MIPAQSFNQTNNLRFSMQNPYDYLLYYYPNFFALELKSTEGTSISYWSEEFEDKNKKQTFMIKKNQIKSLIKASTHKGIVAGFVLNFRKYNHTYFLSIEDFNNMVTNIDKKSFNESDVIKANGYLIEQKIKRVRYWYNIEKFINEIVISN